MDSNPSSQREINQANNQLRPLNLPSPIYLLDQFLLKRRNKLNVNIEMNPTDSNIPPLLLVLLFSMTAGDSTANTFTKGRISVDIL